jgi:hypothetical protein
VADFNGNGHPDYALFNSATRQTAIWYLSGSTFISGALADSAQWLGLGATADFNGDGSQTISFTMPRRVDSDLVSKQ